MKKIGKNSISFDNVFIRAVGTSCGPKEYDGPLGKYFDYYFDDNHCEEENWEKSEIQLQKVAMINAMKKCNLREEDISCVIGGDLNNQLAATNYALRDFNLPYLGIYSACSTCTEAIIIASIMADAKLGNNFLTITSSHNSTSERQFRYPTEYGCQRPNSMTSTVTGAASSVISNIVSAIKVTKATIGLIVDPKLCDSSDMGRAMAPAASATFLQHLQDFNAKPSDYDLILTGDLSTYGSKVFLDIVKELNVELIDNYNDAGLMIYDLEKQNVFAGGSGCACVGLVTFGYVINAMKQGIYKKVLIIATGALLNPIMIAQGESIPSIAHAIVIERS